MFHGNVVVWSNCDLPKRQPNLFRTGSLVSEERIYQIFYNVNVELFMKIVFVDAFNQLRKS